MKILDCKCGSQILIDDEDFEKVSKFVWSCNGTVYRTHHSDVSETVVMARDLIDVPIGYHPEHKDQDTHNNCKSNLRIATKSENMANRGLQQNNTSGYKGVVWDKSRDKWQARIKVNGVLKLLGRFTDKHEAAEVYNTAAITHFGEFACLNQITKG